MSLCNVQSTAPHTSLHVDSVHVHTQVLLCVRVHKGVFSSMFAMHFTNMFGVEILYVLLSLTESSRLSISVLHIYMPFNGCLKVPIKVHGSKRMSWYDWSLKNWKSVL
eukprot:c20577_g2_i1 orf=181-504(-)